MDFQTIWFSPIRSSQRVPPSLENSNMRSQEDTRVLEDHINDETSQKTYLGRPFNRPGNGASDLRRSLLSTTREPEAPELRVLDKMYFDQNEWESRLLAFERSTMLENAIYPYGIGLETPRNTLPDDDRTYTFDDEDDGMTEKYLSLEQLKSEVKRKRGLQDARESRLSKKQQVSENDSVQEKERLFDQLRRTVVAEAEELLLDHMRAMARESGIITNNERRKLSDRIKLEKRPNAPLNSPGPGYPVPEDRVPVLSSDETKQQEDVINARVPTPTSVERQVLKSFKEFAAAGEKMRIYEMAQESKANMLSDLKNFSQNFKLKTPVPSDLVTILSNDKTKQQMIVDESERHTREQIQKQAATPVPQPPEFPFDDEVDFWEQAMGLH